MKNKEKRKFLSEYGLPDKAEYTVKDLVQAELGSQRYLQKLIQEGKLKGVKRGRTYFIPKDNLISYLRGERQFSLVNAETVNSICFYLDQSGRDPQAYFDEILNELINESKANFDEFKETLKRS